MKGHTELYAGDKWELFCMNERCVSSRVPRYVVEMFTHGLLEQTRFTGRLPFTHVSLERIPTVIASKKKYPFPAGHATRKSVRGQL